VNISRKTATDMIRGSKGKVFGVTFIKRTTGEERKMSARTGVRKGVTGEGLKFNPTAKGLLKVWDMNAGKGGNGHRFIPEDGLLTLKVEGEVYEVE